MDSYERVSGYWMTALHQIEVLRCEVDYWRTMWAMECGTTSYWAHVSLTSDSGSEELSKQYKQEHHDMVIEQMTHRHKKVLEDPGASAISRIHAQHQLSLIKEMKV
jgi:hypothetical protein